MESSTPTERDTSEQKHLADEWRSIGDVAAAFVRRMNEADLTPAAVADVVAEDLSALLGGEVAVVLHDEASGATETSVHGGVADDPAGLERAVERRADAQGSPSHFVDIVLDTGELFLAPDGREAGLGDDAAEQQLLAVPVSGNDGTLGVIAATRDDDEPFSGDDLELLSRVADVTALAVRGLRRVQPSQALESAADAIFIIDASGRLLSSNLATQRLLGYSDRELVGRALRDIVADSPDSRRSRDLPDFADPPTASLTTLYELELQRDDGTLIAVELSFARVSGSERDLYVAVGRDVSQRKRFEERLRREATVDPLTGLVNRASAHRALGRSMHKAASAGQVAVLFIDLDGFKHVNDTAGHQAGDEVLRAVAERLTDSVRHDDLVARYGGDEFLVVLEVDKDIDTEVEAVCERIESAFEEPFTIAGCQHRLGASIGLAVQGRDGTTISQLLAHSDADMYRQKHARRPS